METIEEQKTVTKNFKDRLVSPIGITVAASLLVALLALSFSRIFLAGASGGSSDEMHSTATAPVLWASIITILVLVAAAAFSAMKMRSISFNLVIVIAVLAAVGAGAILYSAGELEESPFLYGQPTPEDQELADPENIVTVQALPTNLFDLSEYQADAGVVAFDYIGRGGAHTLRFKDARLNWFELVVNGTSTAQGSVVLEPGQYVIFCSIPGHERMIADLIVQ